MEQTLDEVERLIHLCGRSQHCVINAGKVVLMRKDRRLHDIVAGCELINADGQSVVWASRLLGRPLPERVAGIDVFERLLERAAPQGYRVFFFGARQEIVERVVERAQREHPQLTICGWRNGYWQPAENDQVVAEIREAQPQILFLGISSPKKEYWLSENLHTLRVPFSMGVGGTFDVYAGKTQRAPAWMQRAGLEWLYRFLQEPRRMWRRYLLGNLSFARIVLEEMRQQTMKTTR